MDFVWIWEGVGYHFGIISASKNPWKIKEKTIENPRKTSKKQWKTNENPGKTMEKSRKNADFAD